MKVYVTDEKELIMEPSFKWAGNPNVTVAVKAFGLKATVQVTCCGFTWIDGVTRILSNTVFSTLYWLGTL